MNEIVNTRLPYFTQKSTSLTPHKRGKQNATSVLFHHASTTFFFVSLHAEAACARNDGALETILTDDDYGMNVVVAKLVPSSAVARMPPPHPPARHLLRRRHLSYEKSTFVPVYYFFS